MTYLSLKLQATVKTSVRHPDEGEESLSVLLTRRTAELCAEKRRTEALKVEMVALEEKMIAMRKESQRQKEEQQRLNKEHQIERGAPETE